MGTQVKAVFELLKETFIQWNEDKAPRLAAALAYYTIFSIAPLLIIVIAIAGLWFGEQAAGGQIFDRIQGVVGPDAAKAIQDTVSNASKPAAGILATVIGVVTILLGASGLFGQLQDSLNTIWEVAPKPGLGIVATIKARFISFTMVLGVGFLLLVSGVFSAALTALAKSAGNVLGGSAVLLSVSDFVISFLVITLLFAMIYRILPDVQISWSDVWVGAGFTALLFAIGKFLIGFYLAHTGTASAYGAAGSLVVLLIWIYYSAQILLLGAEFTQVYARRYGREIMPAKNAVSLTAAARAQQGITRPEAVQAAQQQQQTAPDREAGPAPERAPSARQQQAVTESEAQPALMRTPSALPLQAAAALGAAALLGALAVGKSFRSRHGPAQRDTKK